MRHRAAKVKTETLRTDKEIFDVWADFVVAGENLANYKPRLSTPPSRDELLLITDGERLILDGKELIGHITRARNPMPKSTQNYIARCEHFATGALAITRHRLVA